MATEIDILNSNVNEQNNYNSINDNQEDLIHNYNDVDNTNINNHVLPNSMSISKSREKRMTKLLIVGLILPLSVLLNIQSSEIPAWYKKETKEPVYFPSTVICIRILGQIAGTIAAIALLLKSVHIGSSFRILKWRFYKKHRGVIMIISASIQSGEVSYFTLSSIILSFLSVVLLSKDANKRNRIFRQSGQKPKNRLSYMQRQLIVLEIVAIFYLIIGGLIYSKLEGWTFNDAVYFSIITLMTCGTGDYSPTTLIGRIILIIYAIPGILITAYTVYSIYSVISEIIYAKVYKDFTRFINISNDIFFQSLLKHDQTKVNSNDNLNDNQNLLNLSSGNENINRKENIISSTSDNNKSSEIKNNPRYITFDTITDSSLCEEPSSFSDKEDYNNNTSFLNSNGYLNEIGTNTNLNRPKTFMITRRNTFDINQKNVQGMQLYSHSDEALEIDTEKVLKQTRDLNFRQLKLSLGVLIFIIILFSSIYSWIEHWTFFNAVYFCFVNLCTIGYGDIVPKTIYGKSIYIFFIYLAVPSTTWLGTVLFELATGRWEVYIEKTDLEDELIRNDFDRQEMNDDKRKKKLKKRNKGKKKERRN
ncbi:voltage-gated potassium channel [Neocallimastix californiae]|uniref:Voltage-gated potassium channel n=1 Tax=Neocallimastix californiae TaxID=1754190 RepID=A0A1Y2FRE0_9FUNG|nr:voltage-gated potassium channel [Neocallimastix californiae]|eukprot:ORY86571.1 voltage-gated potassium channel [Neocallimastix californiae]